MIIGFDFGRSAGKVSHPRGTMRIENLISEGRDAVFTINEGGDPIKNLDITLDGKRWFVGEKAKQGWNPTQIFENSLVHEHTRVMMAAALSLLPDNEFDVVVGLPIADFQKQKKDLANFLQGHYRLANKSFYVRRVSVFPQALGALWSMYLGWDGNFQRALPPRIGIVDIGFRDCNFAYLEDGEFSSKASWSFPLGMFNAYTAAIQETNLMMSEMTPDNVPAKIYDGLKTKIQSEINPFWNRKEFPIYSTGGGSYWIKVGDQVPNPIYANAIGFHKLGVMKYA